MTPSITAVNALESATVLITLAALPVLFAAAWIIAAARTRAGRAPREAWRDTIAEIGAVAGTLPWLILVLTPRAGEGAVQLMPLVDLADLASADPRTIVEQLVGNLVLFAAAGFFGPIRLRIGLGTVAIGAAAGCTAVEAAQYLFGTGRVASVDDILLNTLGAVLAALPSKRWWRQSPAVNRAALAADQGVLVSACRNWRGLPLTEVSRGTDRAARC